MIRGDVLGIKELDFVIAAKIAGLSPAMIIWRHIFPNTINTLMIITSLTVGQVILLEAQSGIGGPHNKYVQPAGAETSDQTQCGAHKGPGCP